MKSLTYGLIGAGLIIAGATIAAPAPSWTPPPDSARCPSKWGAGDQRGSANHIKPTSVVNAARLIKTGEIVEMGRVLNRSMPLGQRQYNILTKLSAEPAGTNRRSGNEEMIIAEMGQVGTQFDGFAHQTIGDSLYNCFKVDDVATRNGFSKLGIENIGALMTRGLLLDIAALKGVEMLPDTYEITVADLQQALQRQQLTLQPGDAVILHTGWGRLWGKENDRYMKTNPGIDVAASEWLARQDPMLIGADTAPINVTPSPDPKLSNPVHQIALVVNGIFLLENLRLDELAAQRAYEFALIVEPLKLVGATGSTVAPIAVR